MLKWNRKISDLFNRLVNPNNQRIISPEIYANYIFLLIALFGLFTLAANYLIGIQVPSYISFAVFIISISYFFLNRYTNSFRLLISSGFIFILLIYVFYFIYNFGSKGPIAHYSFLILYITLYYSNKILKAFLFSLIIVSISGLYFLEYKIPNFVNQYDSFTEQFFDHLISLIIAMVIFILLIRNLIKTQIKEKEISQESNHLKTTFLANTSHDLRAPANSILSFSQLLQEELTPGEVNKYVNIIHSNSQQLLTLINDIFDISIIESKNLSISRINVNINDILEEIYTNFKREIEVKEKNLDLNIQFGLPMTQSIILIDPVRIKQILTNLLQNAVKHTNNGAIAFGYDKKMDADELIFFVKDTGVGIPEDKQKDIFQRYVTNVDNNKSIKGIGLGLHITSSLVKMMNGKIWLESKEGLGTQFYFTVPINKSFDETS